VEVGAPGADTVDPVVLLASHDGDDRDEEPLVHSPLVPQVTGPMGRAMQARWLGPYVDPAETDENRPRDRRKLSVLWRLLPLLRPHRGRFALAVVTMLAGSGITLVYPIAARAAVDIGMGSSTTDDSRSRSSSDCSPRSCSNAVLVWLRHYSMSWLGERVVADVRAMVFDRVLTLPLGWFPERRSGELVGRLASDVTVIEERRRQRAAGRDAQLRAVHRCDGPAVRPST